MSASCPSIEERHEGITEGTESLDPTTPDWFSSSARSVAAYSVASFNSEDNDDYDGDEDDHSPEDQDERAVAVRGEFAPPMVLPAHEEDLGGEDEELYSMAYILFAVEHDSGVMVDQVSRMKESIHEVFQEELMFQEKERKRYIEPTHSKLEEMSKQAASALAELRAIRGQMARDTSKATHSTPEEYIADCKSSAATCVASSGQSADGSPARGGSGDASPMSPAARDEDAQRALLGRKAVEARASSSAARLVVGLRQHFGSPGCALAGSTALSTLLVSWEGSEAVATATAGAGAVKALLLCVKAHGRDANVLQAACRALVHLCANSDVAKEDAAVEDAAAVVESAARMMTALPAVQRTTQWAADNLRDYSPAGRPRTPRRAESALAGFGGSPRRVSGGEDDGEVVEKQTNKTDERPLNEKAPPQAVAAAAGGEGDAGKLLLNGQLAASARGLAVHSKARGSECGGLDSRQPLRQLACRNTDSRKFSR